MPFEILSINNCRTCWYYMIYCFLSLSLYSLQLRSAPLLRILDWYPHVDVFWSWAVSVKLSVSPFKLELLSHWCVVALSTSALSVLQRYFPCRGFSLHPSFISSKLAFLVFFLYIFNCFCWFSIDINFFLVILSWNLNLLISFTTEWRFFFLFVL